MSTAATSSLIQPDLEERLTLLDLSGANNAQLTTSEATPAGEPPQPARERAHVTSADLGSPTPQADPVVPATHWRAVVSGRTRTFTTRLDLDLDPPARTP